MRDPSNNEDLDHWAGYGNLGRRTLTRLFRKETGMSFVEWRQHIRLLEALTRLGAGEPVTHVALDLGYESPSAFTAIKYLTRGFARRGVETFHSPRAVVRSRLPGKPVAGPFQHVLRAGLRRPAVADVRHQQHVHLAAGLA